MGRRRIHTKNRKREAEQVHTTIEVDKTLWDAAGHLAIDEKKSKAMLFAEALTLYLKLKERLPNVQLPPELEDLIGE